MSCPTSAMGYLRNGAYQMVALVDNNDRFPRVLDPHRSVRTRGAPTDDGNIADDDVGRRELALVDFACHNPGNAAE